MLKKIVLFISILLLINPCFAAVTDQYAYVSALEQKLFGTKFQSENINKRLNRLESDVFGIKSSATVQVRINKLKTAFVQFEKSSVPVKATQKKPVSPKTASIKLKQPQKLVKLEPPVKYAAVDEIEKKVLNRTFDKEDIYKRLNRLEIVVFSRTMNGALNERVENLKQTVFGNGQISQVNTKESPQNQVPQLSDDSVNLLLKRMETDIFNQTFPNEPVDARLSRLETKIFNSSSPEDSLNDRIERLSAVISARPTNELYNDMASVRQYQSMTNKISAAALLLLIMQGLLF